MTRKDFELIAATLKAFRANADNPIEVDCLSEMFADALKATNAQFNRDRFLRACGVSE